jgi:hypothetical protein
MRVVGDEEGKGGKAMATATRVTGEWMATVTKWAIATEMRVSGEQQQWQQRW